MNGEELGKRIIAGILFSVLAGLVLVAASRAKLLPAAPDKFTYDWRTYLLAEQAPHPRDDIAIIRIDERSLTGYNYVSPIDRGLIAEIVKRVDEAGAKAIGLDVIVDRPTEPQKDAALAEAIRQAHAPVILGAVDGRGGESAEGHGLSGRLHRQDRASGGTHFLRGRARRSDAGRSGRALHAAALGAARTGRPSPRRSRTSTARSPSPPRP